MLSRSQLIPPAILSTLAAILTVVAAAAGLFIPGFYAQIPTEELLIGAWSQDLIAIVMAAAMLVAIPRTVHGSVRALIVWTGSLGFLIYGYLLYAFDSLYTPLYLLYLMILGLSLYAMIGLLGSLDADTFREYVTEEMPVRFIAGVLAIPAILIPRWVAGILEGVASEQPPMLSEVLIIDLTFVIPACLLTAYLLWRKRPWGFVLGGVLLVKVWTLCTSLTIATIWATLQTGMTLDWVQVIVYAGLATVGGVALYSYFRHLHPYPAQLPHVPEIGTTVPTS